MIRLLVVCLALWASAAPAQNLRMAVTTSFHNSGLSDILLPALERDTGITLQLLIVGTGQALRLGQAGDVDAVLVHAPAAERAFVAAGFGTHRRQIMMNDFVFIGPAHDPADLRGAQSAPDALTRIASATAPFVSRGDNSGTHQRERALWEAAGITPQGPWYRAVGAGMGAALNTAAAMEAYVLADRGSWLNFGNRQNLALLFAGDPALHNQYSLIPVHPARHPHLDHATTQRFEAWLTSPTAAALINGYRIGGEQLFTFNASP